MEVWMESLSLLFVQYFTIRINRNEFSHETEQVRTQQSYIIIMQLSINRVNELEPMALQYNNNNECVSKH